MVIQKLNALRGWLWVKQGFQLIQISPLRAITLALVCALTLIAALSIPVLGQIAAILFMPSLIAGYARVCRALEEGETVQPNLLLEGFRHPLPRLISLGGFLMLGLLLASIAMIAIGGEALTTTMEAFKSGNDAEGLIAALWSAGANVALSLVVGMSLVFLLMLAFQYAPMLILFSDMPPIAALRVSLAGSLTNLVPYTVYSLIMQVVALLLGILPFGVGLILLLPLGLTSLYVSFRNIFPFPGELAAATPPPDAENI